MATAAAGAANTASAAVEQVEGVEVAEPCAPDERAGDDESDRPDVQAGLDRGLLADHEPGDDDRQHRARADEDHRHGLPPERVERHDRRREPARPDAVAGQDAPADRGHERDPGRQPRPLPHGPARRAAGESASSDWPIRSAQTLPTPTAARTAMTMCEPAGSPQRRSRRTRRAPSWPAWPPARPGRRATAGPPRLPGRTSVISKTMPTASGAGARNRQAANPNRKRPRDRDPVIRRTSVPVRAAAASRSSGRAMRCRASSGSVPSSEIGDRAEPRLAPVVPGLGRQPRDVGEPRWRIERLGAGLGQVRAEDRVVGLVHELERLDAVTRALRHRRAVEQRDGGRRTRAPPTTCHDEVPEPAGLRGFGRGVMRSRRHLRRPPRHPASRRQRRTAASPIASTKPTATGVNELRPPDTIAAHHEVTTIRPDASPTPRISPAGASAPSSPTKRATPTPKSRQIAPISSPWPIDSQTAPSAIVIGSSANTGRTIPSAVPWSPGPDSQGPDPGADGPPRRSPKY